MIVRAIECSDIDSCAELFAEIFREEPWNEAWTQKNATERLAHIYESKGFVGFLMESENNIVGFVLGNIEPFAGGGAFYLREMCVKKEQQGKGIGKKLIAYLHSELSAQKVAQSYLRAHHKITFTIEGVHAKVNIWSSSHRSSSC